MDLHVTPVKVRMPLVLWQEQIKEQIFWMGSQSKCAGKLAMCAELVLAHFHKQAL